MESEDERKLKKFRLRLDTRKFFFSQRVVNSDVNKDQTFKDQDKD